MSVQGTDRPSWKIVKRLLLEKKRTDILKTRLSVAASVLGPYMNMTLSPRTHADFPGASIFLIEQISFFQEALSSPRTHIYFPGDPYASNRWWLVLG